MLFRRILTQITTLTLPDGLVNKWKSEITCLKCKVLNPEIRIDPEFPIPVILHPIL